MVGALGLAKGQHEMTHAAFIPAGVHSHAPLSLTALTPVLLPQLSLIFLVFLCHVWSKQTTNAGILRMGGGLSAVAHHVITDNYKNLTVA